MSAWLDSLQRASIEGAIAIGVAFIFCRLFRRLPAWSHCWLYRLTFGKLLVSLTAVVISIPLLNPQPEFEAPAKSPHQLSPAVAIESSPGPIAPMKVRTKQINPVTILFLVWSSGVAVSLLFLAKQFVSAHRLRRHLRPAPIDLNHAAAGLSANLELYTSARITRPLLLGAFRPVIIFPTHLKASPEQRSLMLAHEFAHIQRRDLLWNWLAVVVQTIFWFHPLVWLGAREWRLAQEMACDEFALRRQPGRAAEYGELLINLATRTTNPAPQMLAAGIFETKSTLERRLNGMKLIQHGKRWPATVAFGAITLAVFAIIPWKLVAQKPPEETKAAATKSMSDTKGVVRSVTKPPDEERVLLLKELDIAEQQRSQSRKAFEAGVKSSEEVVARERDVQHLLRELAELDSDRKAYLESVEAEIGLLKKLETEQENRIKTGVGGHDDLMKLQREELQLQRKLAAAKKEATPKKPEAVSAPTVLKHGRNIEVYPARDGVVSQVSVKPGERVKEGQILLAVDLPEAQIRLRAAQAQMEIAEAEYNLKKLDIDKSIADAGKRPDADYIAQKGKLELQRARAEMEIVHGKLEQAKLDMESSVVTAPHAGLVQSVYYGPGRRVTTSVGAARIYIEDEGDVAEPKAEAKRP